MIVLSNRNQVAIAAIYNNILFLPVGKVIGVLLGHCVFGTDGLVKAKYFYHTLFSLDGLMLGKQNEKLPQVKIDIDTLIKEAWPIIILIKDHTCPMIEPTDQWTTRSLTEIFGTDFQPPK